MGISFWVVNPEAPVSADDRLLAATPPQTVTSVLVGKARPDRTPSRYPARRLCHDLSATFPVLLYGNRPTQPHLHGAFAWVRPSRMLALGDLGAAVADDLPVERSVFVSARHLEETPPLRLAVRDGVLLGRRTTTAAARPTRGRTARKRRTGQP